MPYKNPEDARIASRLRYKTRRENNTFDAVRQKYFSMKTRVMNGRAKICKEWDDNYNSFKFWCESEFMSMGIDPTDSKIVSWYNIDKDASQQGMYSPETCILIPHNLNTVLNTLPFSVRCYNGSNERVSLGCFDTYDEAVRASSMYSYNMIYNMAVNMLNDRIINHRAYLKVLEFIQDRFRF